ncbi:hypothetical protein NL108_012708 [Boleophthalmus pectinirostris]|uniref:clumping factor A n=1 Tax=Boleophthalmus pectinirostris TaxID=150288 RepID=UPI00242F344D|nr:clumping factor A [Boleophthalmus pectinirostris]KAJ0055194.1 hypothetical protein NL108_012708 [Boleophthalmus pectinirostris]
MVCSSSPLLLLLLSVVVPCVPLSSCVPLPTHEPPQLGLALLHLRALLDQPLALELQTHRSSDQDPGLDQNQDQDQEQDLDQDLAQEEELTSVEPFGSWDTSDLDSNQASDQDSQQDSDSESNQVSAQVLGHVLVPDSAQVLGEVLGPDGEQVLSRLGRGDMQRDLEDGGRLTEALTAVAGGLQAVSREKGGFGFRFGRKRWTPRIPTRTGLNQD